MRARLLIGAAGLFSALSLAGSALGAPPTVTYSSGNLNVPIPASGEMGAMAEQAIDVPDSGLLYDIDVKLRLSHPCVGQLMIQLVDPFGNAHPLSANRGSCSDDFGTGAQSCAGNQTTFDMSANRTIMLGLGPFTGSYRPDSVLDNLVGSPTQGTWKLRINDGFDSHVGSLFCWRLVIARDADSIANPVLAGDLNRLFQTSTSFRPAWILRDHTPVTFQVRERWAAPHENSFHSEPDIVTRARSALRRVEQGRTYCYEVFARDAVGNVSANSFVECTSIPLDDRFLAYFTKWRERRAPGYFRGTYRETTTRGAMLVLGAVSPVVADRFAILATKCPGCGTVELFAGSTTLGRFSLEAPTVRKKRPLIAPPLVPQFTGEVGVRVVSRGKPVRIDGLAVLNHQ